MYRDLLTTCRTSCICQRCTGNKAGCACKLCNVLQLQSLRIHAVAASRLPVSVQQPVILSQPFQKSLPDITTSSIAFVQCKADTSESSQRLLLPNASAVMLLCIKPDSSSCSRLCCVASEKVVIVSTIGFDKQHFLLPRGDRGNTLIHLYCTIRQGGFS